MESLYVSIEEVFLIMFYVGAIGFLGGVAFSSIFSLGVYFSFVLGIISIVLLILSRFRSGMTAWVALPVFLFFFSVGIVRVEITPPLPHVPSSFLEKPIVIQGVVAEEPEQREKSLLFVLNVSSFSVGTEKYNWDGRVRVTADRYETISYGDTLSLVGSFQVPESFQTAGGRNFDYKTFLAKENISYVVAFSKITHGEEGGGNIIKKYLFSLKRYFLEKMHRVMPEPESSLLGGLLLGVRESIPNNVLTAMQSAGVIHIVVLSGYNITLVAEAIMRLLGFLTLNVRLLLGGIAIFLFAVMTGGSASVIRASVMAVLVLVARATQRTYAIVRALIAAAVLMVLWSPNILLYDLSFQLSFLATLGLITLSPYLTSYFSFLPEKGGFRDYAASTVGTQIAVLPLLLYAIGTLSFLSLPANLLMLPFIPLAMFFGFVATLLMSIHFYLALPFAFMAYLFLKYEIWVSVFIGSLPFASISVPSFPFIFLGVAYTALLYLVLKINRKA